VLESISNGESFDMDATKKAIQSCVASIMRNANALLWLTQVKNQDRYTAEHSLRVGILAIAFGRFLDFEEPELELLGLCGMLHDVGKVKIPDEILNKPARLTRIEFDIMKEHASLGKDILLRQKGVDKLIIDTANYHHERIDGKGYPEQLNASYLHKYVRMVSIVDVYDAITSARPYKVGSPAFDALKILFSERDKHFDNDLVEAFIRMVGIYPPGTLVEMTNGEVGIVVSANPDSRLRPKVELVLTADKKIRPPYIINLLDGITDKSGSVYVIKEGVTNGTYGVDIKDYILK
jgi:putative nucleotidyltransferase with HDIG domain